MLLRRTLVVGGSLVLSAAVAVAAFALPARLGRDPSADVVHLPVPLPIGRLEARKEGLSLVSIWQMDTHQTSIGDVWFEPSFEFQGQPGALGLLSVSVLGYDRAGKLIFSETQKAADGRLIDPKDAVVRAGTFLAARSRLSAPSFRFPRETLNRLAKADLVFEQFEPGRVFQPPKAVGQR